MKCLKCGMRMYKGCCPYCGYMENGNTVDTKKKIELSLLEVYLDKNFDKIIRNQNWFITGLLGPTYLFCHGFYGIGFILILLDSLCSSFFMVFIQALTFNAAFLVTTVALILNCGYWLVNRLFWATFTNLIYERLLVKRINRIKKKYPNDYRKRLKRVYFIDYKFLILKYVCFMLASLTIYLYLRGIINYYIWNW